MMRCVPDFDIVPQPGVENSAMELRSEDPSMFTMKPISPTPLGLVSISLIWLVAWPPVALAADRPNILWLIAEDFGPARLLRDERGPHAESRPTGRRGRPLHAVLHDRAGLLRRAVRPS